jgi:hypothetical protein
VRCRIKVESRLLSELSRWCPQLQTLRLGGYSLSQAKSVRRALQSLAPTTQPREKSDSWEDDVAKVLQVILQETNNNNNHHHHHLLLLNLFSDKCAMKGSDSMVRPRGIKSVSIKFDLPGLADGKGCTFLMYKGLCQILRVKYSDPLERQDWQVERDAPS